MSNPSPTIVPVTLKWNKQVYTLQFDYGETSTKFKQRIEQRTGVPVHRQKLLAKKGGWKGPLKDDIILDSSVIKMDYSSSSATTTTTTQAGLAVTLIGSAETLSGPTKTTTFIEDLSPEELRAAEEAQAQATMATAEGMIPALQLPPHKRDDHKQEMYQYNRLVTGLPQRQIEQELKYGQGASNHRELQGKVVMTLGMELRRAYVNDLAVIGDGTCVGVMDDGHVQLWKHGTQQHDILHASGAGSEGGVDTVVALHERPSLPAAFATAGRGVLQLWTADADPIVAIQSAMPGTTPASLTCLYGGLDESKHGSGISDHKVENKMYLCLASRFRVTRQENPFQFHLPPQNDVERQRRAQAEAQERAIQAALAKASRSVQVWFALADTTASTTQSLLTVPSLQSKILEPPMGLAGSAPITALACLSLANGGGVRFLVAGDMQGGIRVWKVQPSRSATGLEFHHAGYYQLTPSDSHQICSVVTMSALVVGDSRCQLAISTDVASGTTAPTVPDATILSIPAPRAVHIFDLSSFATTMEDSTPVLQSSLMGHTQDAVICLCQLPNGDLLNGGGKLDATLQLWSKTQMQCQQDDGTASEHVTSQKALADVGYVFALAVCEDVKEESNYYAVAVARYNSVKIVI